MIKRIVFYDFDSTLISTLMPEVGKQEWEKIKKTPFPYKGWWGRPESLNPDVFNIKAFPNVKERLNQDIIRNDTYTVILTSRIKKLLPQLEEILRRNNITVDEISPKYGAEDKDDRIKMLFKKFPNVTQIDLYDDRDKELILFKQLKKEISNKIKVNIYKVNNDVISQIFEINVNKLTNEQAEAYIKKYRKLIR